jgi:hypothetical protein
MPAAMPKPKKNTEPAPEPKPISYRPSAGIYAAMHTYQSLFRYKPSYSEVIEDALRLFFEKEGVDIPDPSPPSN